MINQTITGLVGIKIAQIESKPTSIEVLASSGRRYVFFTHPNSTCTHTELATIERLLKSQARTTSASITHEAELLPTGLHYTSTLCFEYKSGKIVLEWDLITREYLPGLVSYSVE